MPETGPDAHRRTEPRARPRTSLRQCARAIGVPQAPQCLFNLGGGLRIAVEIGPFSAYGLGEVIAGFMGLTG